MKKVLFLITSILLVLVSSDEENKDITPKGLEASDGFYVACIIYF